MKCVFYVQFNYNAHCTWVVGGPTPPTPQITQPWPALFPEGMPVRSWPICTATWQRMYPGTVPARTTNGRESQWRTRGQPPYPGYQSARAILHSRYSPNYPRRICAMFSRPMMHRGIYGKYISQNIVSHSPIPRYISGKLCARTMRWGRCVCGRVGCALVGRCPRCPHYQSNHTLPASSYGAGAYEIHW